MCQTMLEKPTIQAEGTRRKVAIKLVHVPTWETTKLLYGIVERGTEDGKEYRIVRITDDKAEVEKLPWVILGADAPFVLYYCDLCGRPLGKMLAGCCVAYDFEVPNEVTLNLLATDERLPREIMQAYADLEKFGDYRGPPALKWDAPADPRLQPTFPRWGPCMC